jgi:hypothetical protein
MAQFNERKISFGDVVVLVNISYPLIKIYVKRMVWGCGLD